MKEFGPKRSFLSWFQGPDSTMVAYAEPLGSSIGSWCRLNLVYLWVVVKILVPFCLGPQYSTAPNIWGTQKRDHKFDNHPYKRNPKDETCWLFMPLCSALSPAILKPKAQTLNTEPEDGTIRKPKPRKLLPQAHQTRGSSNSNNRDPENTNFRLAAGIGPFRFICYT